MTDPHELDAALLIAAEGQASGDTSAMALAAATLADEVRRLRDEAAKNHARWLSAEDRKNDLAAQLSVKTAALLNVVSALIPAHMRGPSRLMQLEQPWRGVGEALLSDRSNGTRGAA